MAESQSFALITYVDSSEAEWQEFRPGSRRNVLYEDPQRGHLTCWFSGMRDTGWAQWNTTNTTSTFTFSQVHSWTSIVPLDPAPSEVRLRDVGVDGPRRHQSSAVPVERIQNRLVQPRSRLAALPVKIARCGKLDGNFSAAITYFQVGSYRHPALMFSRAASTSRSNGDSILSIAGRSTDAT